MKRTVSLALVAVAVIACGQVSPTPPSSALAPSPSPVVAQRHVCGELQAEPCEAVIARVIGQVPGMAVSPIAVADVREEGSMTRRGGDFVTLVSFEPVGDEDLWMNPPTWVVTQPMLSQEMRIEPWRGGPLPAHFVRLLRSAGLDG